MLGVGGTKNLLGDYFVSRNDDFTKGWVFDITHWGMVRKQAQKGRDAVPSCTLHTQCLSLSLSLS